ncbi:MAG: hypothetical protein IKE58_10960 [Blautia sp.]|nr:hypothetical protein [Blautia sp.]
MKRTIALLISAVMLLAMPVFAEEDDYEAYYDEEGYEEDYDEGEDSWEYPFEEMDDFESLQENELNYSDIEETLYELEDRGITGDFVYFDMGLMIWLPDFLKESRLSEKDIEEGYVGYYVSEDEETILAVTYHEDLVKDLAELEKAIKKRMEEVSDVTSVRINGIDGLSYYYEGEDTLTIDLIDDYGGVTEFSFYPGSDKDFALIATIMTATIQYSW